ncbi:MAG: hypothetical protein KJN71_09025 [Acidimicrobiia bacterium]|nr:hypothetical protein [Acidimicrobiia bacterium]
MRRVALLAAIAIAATACSGTTDSATTTAESVATTTSTTEPATTTATSTTTVATSTTTTTTTVPSGPLGPPPFQTWTVIVASLDVDTTSEAEAVDQWKSLVGDRPDSGVLLSDNYPSLNPGYWVVFAGEFDTELAATGLCADLQGESLACYHRWLGSASAMAEEVLVYGGDADPGWFYVRTATGATRPVYDRFFEASGPGHPSITADGSEMYFTVGYEDYWFSCELTIGEIRRLDFATGEELVVAAGLYPSAHPSAQILAYASDDECFEDEFGFNSFNDLVVVRDLRNGINRVYQPGEVDPGFTIDLAWSADGETLFVARDTDFGLEIHSFDPLVTSTSDPWTSGGPLDLGIGGFDWLRLVGERAGKLHVIGCATGVCDLVAIDLETGDGTTVASDVAGAAFDAHNDHLIHWSIEGPLVVEGQPVELPADFFIYEADW